MTKSRKSNNSLCTGSGEDWISAHNVCVTSRIDVSGFQIQAGNNRQTSPSAFTAFTQRVRSRSFRGRVHGEMRSTAIGLVPGDTRRQLGHLRVARPDGGPHPLRPDGLGLPRRVPLGPAPRSVSSTDRAEQAWRARDERSLPAERLREWPVHECRRKRSPRSGRDFF